jgi:SAM-dependent methyltransferase
MEVVIVGRDAVAKACPLCGPGPTELEFEAGLVTPPLVRCVGCALVFQATDPPPAQLAAAYDETYGPNRRRFGRLVEAAVRMFRLARVRLAVRLIPEGARVLDVGCGRGTFLAMLAERGYEVRGFERSSSAAALAGTTAPVDFGEFRPGSYPRDSFDLVCLWHVLEHAHEPDVMLAAVRACLAPNGKLLMAVPNYASLQAQWGREHWFPLDLPRHICHFTPATLARLLEAAGLRIDTVHTGQWEMDPFAVVQTALNRMGVQRDALYTSLYDNAAARSRVPVLWRPFLFAFAAIAAAPACLFSIIERALGRGGTLIVTASRADNGSGSDAAEASHESRESG